MSDRERWVVYPLLVFALFLGFKNASQRTGIASFKTVECNSIVVNSEFGEKRIQLQATPENGRISIFGAQNTASPVVQIQSTIRKIGEDGLDTVGQIEVSNSKTASRAVLSGFSNGPNLELYSHPFSANLAPTQPLVTVGFNQKTQKIGVTAETLTSSSKSATAGKQSTAALSEEGVVFTVKTVAGTDRDARDTDADSPAPKDNQPEKEAEKSLEETGGTS